MSMSILYKFLPVAGAIPIMLIVEGFRHTGTRFYKIKYNISLLSTNVIVKQYKKHN